MAADQGWGGAFEPRRSFGCYACGAPNPFPGLCQPCAGKHKEGLIGQDPGAQGRTTVPASPQAPSAPLPAQAPIQPAVVQLVASTPAATPPASAPRKRGRPRKVAAPEAAPIAAPPIDDVLAELRERVERGDLDRGEALVALVASTELSYALADRLSRI